MARTRKPLIVPRWAIRAGLSLEEYRHWLESGRGPKSKSVKAVAASSLGVDMDSFEAPVKYTFSLLLGASRTWRGPGNRLVWVDGQRICRGCGQIAEMPVYAYCIEDGCDRSGRDHLIRASSRAAAKRCYSPDPALKGGVG